MSVEIILILASSTIMYFLFEALNRIKRVAENLEAVRQEVSELQDSIAEAKLIQKAILSSIDMLIPEETRIDNLVRQGFPYDIAWDAVHSKQAEK